MAKGISDKRQLARRDLLRSLDTLGKTLPDNPHFEQADRCEQKAYDLIFGDAKKLFDLAQETDDMRERYGRNTFGQSCLMARRLVEKGVRFITINYRGWDTHKQHFQTMRRRLPEMDKGVATLLDDLSAREARFDDDPSGASRMFRLPQDVERISFKMTHGERESIAEYVGGIAAVPTAPVDAWSSECDETDPATGEP